MKDNIVGQGGKGEDNWTIGFRQHGHQGVTPWVASHAFLVIIIVSIIIVIIVNIIVIPWVASFIKSSCLPTDRGGRYMNASQKSCQILERSLERLFGFKNQMCLTKMYPGVLARVPPGLCEGIKHPFKM